MKKLIAVITVCCMAVMFTSCKRTAVQQTENTELTEVITSVNEETAETVETSVPKLRNSRFKAEKERLPEKLKPVYEELEQKVLSFEPFELEISETLTLDEVNEVCYALRHDNPSFWLFFNTAEKEIFFDENGNQAGCRYVVSSYSENWDANSTFNPEDVITLVEQCDEVADEIIESIPVGSTEEEAYSWIAKAICEKTEFEDNSENGHYLYMTGPLLSGIGICQSYSQAYEYVCHRAGLWCDLQHSTEICHCWNVIMIAGNIYHCDITWYDNDGNETWLKFGQNEAKISHCPIEGQIIAVNN